VCEIGPDGVASVAEPRRSSGGKITARDGAAVVAYDDDRVERWTPVGRKAVVEHWYPASAFPSGAPVLGIAEAEARKTKPLCWGPVTKGLQMSIRLRRGRYRAGEPVTLEVVIRNTLDKEADLGMSASDLSSFDFVVRYVGGGMGPSRRVRVP